MADQKIFSHQMTRMIPSVWGEGGGVNVNQWTDVDRGVPVWFSIWYPQILHKNPVKNLFYKIKHLPF